MNNEEIFMVIKPQGENMEQFKRKQEHGYLRDMEQTLRDVGGALEDSIAIESANQIKHLKEALKELISIVEIHSACTKNNFAWAELDYAKEALNFTGE